MLAALHAITSRKVLRSVRRFSTLASSRNAELSCCQNTIARSSTTSFQSLCRKGHAEEALKYFLFVLKTPPLDAYLALVKACIIRQALPITLFVYSHVILNVWEFFQALGDYFAVALAKCGAVDDAYSTSCRLTCRTVFSWTAIISACVDHGRAQDALRFHALMKDDGVEPNEFTYASLLKACGILRDLQSGKELHDDLREQGFGSFHFVGNTIVSMYGKCGAITDAVDAFISLQERGVVAWNAMLSAYVEQSQGEDALRLYRTMQELGVDPDQLTFMSALQACGILAEEGEDSAVEAGWTRVMCHEIVQALHSEVRKRGFLSNIYVGTTLIYMYGKVGTIEEAENVFVAMPVRNMVSWNAMLSTYSEQGDGERALQFYRLILEEKMDPDHHTLATALKACYILANEEESSSTKGKCLRELCLEVGEAIYHDAQKKALTSDPFIGTSLLSVYGKCGASFEAERLLSSLPHRNVISWTAMLSAYLSGGQAAKALQSYRCMVAEGLEPDQQALVLAIQACSGLCEKEMVMAADVLWAKTAAVNIGHGLHSDARKMGLSFGVFFGSSLVSMYGKLGSIVEAECAFLGLSQGSVIAWTALISAYVEQVQGGKALQLYMHMHEQGVSPDEHAVLAALQACNSFVENEEDTHSAKVLALKIAQALHEDISRLGYASDAFLTSNLLSVYGKCGSIKDAELMFSTCLQHNIVSCTVMASCFMQQGDGETTLKLYRDMQREQMVPDSLMVAFVIQACGMLRPIITEKEKPIRSSPLEIVQALHADARRKGFEFDSEVGKALVTFYGEFGTIEEAENMFISLPKNNCAFWNAMLSAYVHHSQGEKALQFYACMQEEGLDPDTTSFVLALQACGTLGRTEEANGTDGMSNTMSSQILQALHGDACRKGFTSDILCANTIVNTYGKCGTITEAEEVFCTLPAFSVSSWNAMLSAYINEGLAEKALRLFARMQIEHVVSDEITVICALQACGETGNLTLCQHLHDAVVVAGHDVNSSLMATLIHAYGRCTCNIDGQAVFEGLGLPNLASSTACLAGHAGKGLLVDSLMLFEDLRHAGGKLDRSIFTSIIGACSHTGLVVDGLELFASTSRDYGINLDATHYGSIVDLLGRAGDFKRVEDLLGRLPAQPDSSTLSSLLGACRVHGNMQLGKHAFGHALESQTKEVSTYVIMSNIFADGVCE